MDKTFIDFADLPLNYLINSKESRDHFWLQSSTAFYDYVVTNCFLVVKETPMKPTLHPKVP